MRKTVQFSGAILLAACASGSSGAPDIGPGVRPQVATMSGVTGVTTGVSMTTRTEANSTSLYVPVEKAWAALEMAYAQLGIPVAERDEKRRLLGNPAFRTRRRIGDVPMVRALDCGGDSGMPNSETYQIILTIQSQVTANEAGGTTIQTVVEGSGRNPMSGGTSDVRCSSSGGLEKRIAELVREKASK